MSWLSWFAGGSDRSVEGSPRRMTTGGLAPSCACQLIERHSDRSSQRTHSFILVSVEMTVPKQSLVMRDTGNSAPWRLGADPEGSGSLKIIYWQPEGCQP